MNLTDYAPACVMCVTRAAEPRNGGLCAECAPPLAVPVPVQRRFHRAALMMLPAYCGCCGCITRYCICSCCCGK